MSKVQALLDSNGRLLALTVADGELGMATARPLGMAVSKKGELTDRAAAPKQGRVTHAPLVTGAPVAVAGQKLIPMDVPEEVSRRGLLEMHHHVATKLAQR